MKNYADVPPRIMIPATAPVMNRDSSLGKTQFHRVFEGPMLWRWAVHLTNGSLHYPDLPNGRANWTLAHTDAEQRRFQESAVRHFFQWMSGDRTEDHAAAVFFNINGYEYTLQASVNGPPPGYERVP